ncbi:MAG TPA: aldo/keto reductase [Candidatus Thermoplasmatota archaeon]|nr:aldo/keto reductase [Candidatus Thermoplasmatota archaeon]
MLGGCATPEGTARHAGARPAARGHWRVAQGLQVASVGMGTYLGAVTPQARDGYQRAALAYLARGNLLDTASNYRDQASERDLGAALQRFVDQGGDRSGVVVVTKAGFLHGDADEPDAPAWFAQTFLGPGLVEERHLRMGHCLAPAFLRTQVGRSRANLRLETIDFLLLHNVEHPLLAGVGAAEHLQQVEDAFTELEALVDAGRIGAYGVATWGGLRVRPGVRGHLPLVRLVHHAGVARQRAGGRAGQHHFRAVELPVNLAMPEAAREATQPWRFGEATALQCCADQGWLTLASASLAQGRRPATQAERARLGVEDPLLAALQFTRSLPGVTSALVGMGQARHAEAAMALASSRSPDPAAATALLPEL